MGEYGSGGPHGLQMRILPNSSLFATVRKRSETYIPRPFRSALVVHRRSHACANVVPKMCPIVEPSVRNGSSAYRCEAITPRRAEAIVRTPVSVAARRRY